MVFSAANVEEAFFTSVFPVVKRSIEFDDACPLVSCNTLAI